MRELIRSQIEGYADSIETDRLGNLIARLNPRDHENAPRVMLSAHMDEVGFMVTWITPEGYLKFDTVGGIDERVLCGRNVTVGEGENRLNGIISS